MSWMLTIGDEGLLRQLRSTIEMLKKICNGGSSIKLSGGKRHIKKDEHNLELKIAAYGAVFVVNKYLKSLLSEVLYSSERRDFCFCSRKELP